VPTWILDADQTLSSSGNLGKASFRDVVKNVSRSPSCLLVQEAPTLSIPIMKDVVSKAALYNTNALVFRFNGLWPPLVDLHNWVLDFWKLELKEAFIYPGAKGFFIVVYI